MENVTHDQAVNAINTASKERLVLALRAFITAQLWEATEEELRNALHNAIHDLSPAEVYNALVEGA